MATTRIEESLLKSNNLGQDELITFVKEREDGNYKKLQDPLPNTSLPHFQPFMKAKRKRVKSVLPSKPTESLFNASLLAYDAGRRVVVRNVFGSPKSQGDRRQS